MRSFCFSFLLFVTLLAGPAMAAPERLPDTRPRADDAAVRSALQDIRRRHGVPGMAAAVFDRETIRAFGVGELVAGGNPVTPESRFRAGQVSLLFTGISAAALIADGSMPAAGELHRLAPEVDFHNPWSATRPVRVADLLAHRAGIGATHFRDVFTDVPDQPLLAGINSAFRALRLEHPPGEREHYSIVGYAIAAYLVEKAAGFPYAEVLARMIFQPLETNGTLGRPDGPLPADAVGHAGRPARTLPVTPFNFPSAGDLWISADGLARTGRLLLNRGQRGDRRVLSPEAVAWLETAPEGGGLVPGSRHGVFAEEYDGFLFYTQTGALPGFLARFAYSPELGRGYVVLLNHGGARSALAEAEALLRGQLLDGSAQPGPVPAPADKRPGDIEGWYRNVSTDAPQRNFHAVLTGVAKLARCGDDWCFFAPGQRHVLRAFDATRFRETGRWQPGWEVRSSEEGVLLVTAGERWQRVSGWQVLATAFAGLIVLAGAVLAIALLAYWSVVLPRRRVTRYHELVPRLLPVTAMLTLIAFQVAVFVTDYPALGEVSGPTVTILVLSILGPVLTALAVPAVVAGFVWKLPLRAALAGAGLAIAACIAASGMFANGLIAFQTWNY